MSPTKQECIDAAAVSLAEAELGIRRGTVAEAAARAWTPTGPPVEELEARIRAIREADTQTAEQRGSAGETPAARFDKSA